MVSFPQPGTVTVCEINRILVTAENLSEDQAKETYAKILGTVFSPVSFQYDKLLAGPTEEQIQERSSSLKLLSAALQAALSCSIKPLLQPNNVKLLEDIDIHAVSWHPYKNILAFVSGEHQITIRDYEDPEGKDPSVLTSDSQKYVKCLEWRPNGGKMLSVACKGGICIWAASYPGNSVSIRYGGTLGSTSRASGTIWTLVDFLRDQDDELISAISWSPDGKYLASASFQSSSFTIWDVAQGIGTPIRRGLGGISLLKWSPSGDYFFASKFDGTFYLWETNTWTSEPWTSISGHVTGANWDPDGRMVLIAFSDSSTLGSLHFASKPPLLDAHLVPVELPEIHSLTGRNLSRAQFTSLVNFMHEWSDIQGIEKIAWDFSGERLAISFKDGDELYRGLIAIYNVKRTPLISTSLIGFIRGPGDNPKPIAFSFHDRFKQGPLLSVCWSSGSCCTYPLIFRSPILP